MTATLPSLDPHTTGPKTLVLSLRAASLACATGRQSISSKELPALQEHFGRGEWGRTMFCKVTRSRKSAVKDPKTCFGLPSQ
jgi:hypothetical protein